MGQLYSSDEARWRALEERDPGADGHFFYSVSSTGVYCRPGCTSKLALRRNVRFHDSASQAEHCGFRPCKRCRPGQESLQAWQTRVILEGCRRLDDNDNTPTLEVLAASANLSPSHFHRLFRKIVGLTPGQYVRARRAERVKTGLRDQASVTEAIHCAGYNSSGHFCAQSPLGMTALQYRGGGIGMILYYALADSWLGAVLVAFTSRGLCRVGFGQDPDKLRDDLVAEFPRARLERCDGAFSQWVEAVIQEIERPDEAFDVPLDLQGSAFQYLVWEALRAIPKGQTRSYGEVAQQVGRPGAARAVARACATNPVAVVVPCHRVVGNDGQLRGYRWGVGRKQQLLERERELPGNT